MSQVKCSICKKNVDSKICIMTKTEAGLEKICCIACKSEFASEIQNIQNNPKLILANIPIKKV